MESRSSEKKEIKSVNTGTGCRESFPCQHSVTISYTNGSTEERWMNGRDIAEHYSNYLNKEDKEHFSIYVQPKPKSSLLGFFNNIPGNNSNASEESKKEDVLNLKITKN